MTSETANDPAAPKPLRAGRSRFDVSAFRLGPWVADPQQGILFTDQVGPWFDRDGSEIVIPCSEAFETAIEDVPGDWTIRSNIPALDRQTMTIGFPEITLLAQYEWDRVTGAAPRTARRSFLLQLDGLEPTIGQVCEQLLVESLFHHLGNLAWPDGQLMATIDAIEEGLLKQVATGTRSDDVTVVMPDGPLALVEVKATRHRWSGLRRPVRDRAIGQLCATDAANQSVDLDLIVLCASLADKQIGVFRLPASHLKAQDEWIAAYGQWKPTRRRVRRPRIPADDESDETHTRLQPGRPAQPGQRYSRIVRGNVVWADPHHAGDPFVGGTGGWDDPLISAALGSATQLRSAAPDMELLLPWALGLVVACTPDAIGLIAPADHSGPRATSLLANFAHPTRARSFAAELVTAACLTFKRWPSVDGQSSIGQVRMGGGRVDFGVKLTGTHGSRATAEADILVTSPTGDRYGVDVKNSAHGRFSSTPSPAMLDVLDEAIDRGEISSFHFLTNGRFTVGFQRALTGHSLVFAHEHVWPGSDDQQRIRTQATQRVRYSQLISEFGTDLHRQRFDVRNRIFDEYTRTYREAFGQMRDIRWIALRGQEHLFDTTVEGPPAPPPRLLAIGGDSSKDALDRDRNFMRGFPLASGPYDRGHLLARESGGAEGIGMNLVPQDSRLNRGQSRDGRRWRSLEREAAASPGTLVIDRAIYDDETDVPAWLEIVHIRSDQTYVVDRFPNRLSLP